MECFLFYVDAFQAVINQFFNVCTVNAIIFCTLNITTKQPEPDDQAHNNWFHKTKSIVSG